MSLLFAERNGACVGLGLDLHGAGQAKAAKSRATATQAGKDTVILCTAQTEI